MPHLAVHVLGVGACFDHPGCMRGSQATPVDPGQTEFARGRLDVPRQNVVVSHGRARLNGLEHEILRPIRLHHLVMPDRQSGFDVNRELLEMVDALNHTGFNADGGIARLALWCIPVTAAAALIYRQRVCSYILPFQSDQFTDAKPGPNRHEYHAGVRLGDQLSNCSNCSGVTCGLVFRFPRLSAGRRIPSTGFLTSNPYWTAEPRMLDSTSFILSFDSCARGEAAIPLGLFNGDLAHIRDGQTVIHSFKHPQGTVIQQLLPDADGSVFSATNYGLLGWRNDKALTLTRKNGLPCEQVYAIAFDRSNDLWLYMNCALGLVTSADFQAWKQNPDITVPVRTFDALDGVRPNYASFVAGARSADGRLWFANGLSLQVIDPEHLSRNIVPPLVHIEQVIADRATYPAQGVLQLPPLTRNLEIDYAGLSFVAPQKVRFRYRLGGRDNAWQEPGTRRQAFYNDLRPGQYRFRVIACNNDGVWNEAGASFSFFVTPAWYQTRSFIIACFAAGVLLIMLLHWLRMRQATNALSARFDERLAERTRIAREFYDTLLQTIEGSKLVADDALDQPADPARMRRAVEQLSEWLSRAIQEGRAALQSLRTSTTETNDLAEGLHRATEECRMFSPMKTSLSVQGETREMHPVVRDEVYRIAYEAIRNACVHSKASELAVELKYSQDLSIRVSDNGVGIPAPLISHGKDGHYGLRGMRERAERIGGKLKVISSANSGTEITVVIPGRVIFLRPDKSPIEKIISVFRDTK